MQTLRDIIGFIHARPNTDEKGRLFELLCLYFLRHDKLQQELFSDTWFWRDSPISNGQPDTGIDIVARISGSESFCAVQCKFRGDDSSITKSEIDSFLALSSKTHFSQRILFTLTDNLNANARNALVDQSPNVRLLTLQALNDSSIDWSAFSFDDLQRVRYNVKTLRDHQVRAVNDVLSGFA